MPTVKVRVYWLTNAAEQGRVLAQYNLALRYYNGEGVEKDLKKAVYWLSQAAEQGDVDAQNLLADINANMKHD